MKRKIAVLVSAAGAAAAGVAIVVLFLLSVLEEGLPAAAADAVLLTTDAAEAARVLSSNAAAAAALSRPDNSFNMHFNISFNFYRKSFPRLLNPSFLSCPPPVSRARPARVSSEVSYSRRPLLVSFSSPLFASSS